MALLVNVVLEALVCAYEDKYGLVVFSIISGKRDSMGLPTAPGLTQELASITKALAEATKMIKLQVGGVLF